MTVENKVIHHTMGHVLAQAGQTSLDPELSARLTANTLKQVLKAHRRADFMARVLWIWWAPLRTARNVMRLFTD